MLIKLNKVIKHTILPAPNSVIKVFGVELSTNTGLKICKCVDTL